MASITERINAATGRVKADLVLQNAKIVDVFCHKIIDGSVAICGDRIVGIGDYEGKTVIDLQGQYVMPSFFDTHVHFESSMLTPNHYLELVATRGVTVVNADPHEIANVCGEQGIAYMIDSARDIPVDVNFMLPSCVPATPFDHGNAIIDSKAIQQLKAKYDFFGLAEMMNYPGLLNCDQDVVGKISQFDVIDGHAPRLSGKELNAYRCGGILTDHESETMKEVLEKISRGMYIQIREGSQTKNLKTLIKSTNHNTMRRMVFCTDDRYVGDIMESGSIANCIAMAVDNGIDPIDAIMMASLNSYECYRIFNKGAVAPNYYADLVVSSDITAQNISYVFKNGQIIAKDGKATFHKPNVDDKYVTNTVNIKPVKATDFELAFTPDTPVMQIIPDTVVTKKVFRNSAENLNLCAVVERHKASGNIGKCYVEGFNLRGGAIAQTVGHDAHNITVIGDNSSDMALAVNSLGREGGMVLVVDGKVEHFFHLPIAGLMSDKTPLEVVKEHNILVEKTKALHINEEIEPYMLLSFLSLIVIPELKITDSGLFDVTKFEFVK